MSPPATSPVQTQTSTPAGSQGTSRTRGEVDHAAAMRAALSEKVMESEAVARAYLVKHLYLVPDQTIQMSTFSNILTVMAYSNAAIPASVKEGMLAVARTIIAFERRAMTKDILDHAGATISEKMKGDLEGLAEANTMANNLADKLCQTMAAKFTKEAVAAFEKAGEDLGLEGGHTAVDGARRGGAGS